MNKILKYIIIIIGVSMTFIGCTNNFDEMNISPNNPTPENIHPKHQLIFILSRSIPFANNWQQQDQLLISTLCEYGANDQLSASDYNIDSRYADAIWNTSYENLANINALIKYNESNLTYNNIVQMTRIWKSLTALRLTNCFGDVPYSEVGHDDIIQPKYDTQKEIYYTLFDELKDAASKLDESVNNAGSYDLLYGGDAAKWKKLANSIRLRMAVRISDVDFDKAKTEASSAIADGVFTQENDVAYMARGQTAFEQHPIYFHRDQAVMHMSTAYKRIVQGIGGELWPTSADREINKNITEAIVNAKNAPEIVDPRAPIHFEPAGIIETPATEGMSSNWDGTDPGNITSAVGASMLNGQFTSDFAKIGPWFYETAERSYPIMKYSELCFLKAIAIERGLITGDAKSAYEDGVKSSMSEFEIPENVIERYLTSTSANYYGTTANYDDLSGMNNTPMDKILTQKYIAQFQECSWETWADHRQFHKPILMPFANVDQSVFNMNPSDRDNNTPNAYIKRIYYVSQEYTVNENNVREAESRMGSNSIQNNVWWDID